MNVYAITNDDNKEQNNSQFIKINNTVSIDNNISIILYLDYVEYDNFTFKMYSSNSLEEVNTTDIDLQNFNNEEISFDYCINCSTLKTITLNYKLPESTSVGDNITFSIQLINKDNVEEIKNYRTTVTVIDKVDEEKNKEKETEKKDFSRSSNISYSRSSSTSSKSNTSTKYLGSSNNYLSNLSVNGYQFNKSFLKERLTYFVTVPNNVTSLKINATKENSNSTINISGNSDFSVGLNKVLISVIAQNGSIKNYRLYVTRMDSESNEKEA